MKPTIKLPFRTGFGIDFHQLVTGRDLWIGGVKLEHTKGALGHSDADVLIHAICDALLGALCLGDIGLHFPDTDESYKNIDSKILLKKTIQLVNETAYVVGNIDSTIDETQVSIKATTSEKMGFVGREEGIAAYATVLLIAE